jgi:cytidine deaminase
MPKPILFIDLDNVLSDTDPIIRSLIEKHVPGISKPILRRHVTCFNYYEAFGFDKALEKPVWEDFYRAGLNETVPVAGALEAMLRFCQFAKLEVVSHRPEKTKQATKQWLKKHRIPYDQLWLIKDTEKVKMVRQSNDALLIDDKGETIDAIARQGRESIVFDNPWNRSFARKGTVRGKNWPHIFRLLIRRKPYQSSMYELLANLHGRAQEAAQLAYTPYSGYQVGAALLTVDGNIFTGCNIENVSFSPTVCAERTAVFKAVSCGYRRGDLFALAVAARKRDGRPDGPSPCGVCRQVINEFSDANFPVLLAVGHDGDSLKIRSFDKYLPFAFSNF